MLKQFYFKQFSLANKKKFSFKQFTLPQLRSLNTKTVLFQAIQFSVSTYFSSIWVIDGTLSAATNPGQSGPGNDGIEEVLHISQRSSITGTSPSDCLMLYPGLSLRGLTPLHRCNRCILQPQPIGQYTDLNVKTLLFRCQNFFFKQFSLA